MIGNVGFPPILTTGDLSICPCFDHSYYGNSCYESKRNSTFSYRQGEKKIRANHAAKLDEKVNCLKYRQNI